ncbi:ATP-binding response regulator [Pelagibius marinus]|uniref:ATP-binding response regulator n=1 Tax=Pelagibius marinus TaxID=2762760 RepID=UPI001872B102|nr:HAMP domain-containing sensor histidine kinase [Pelagibius marinus]
MKQAGKARGGGYFLEAQHQLRQPLNALSLLIGELRQSADSGDREAIVDDMRYALDLSNAWLDSLADLEKAENDLLQLRPQEVLLQQVFARLYDEFLPHFTHLGLDFRVVASRAVVRADPVVLRRLLTLLLDNAAKFTPDGKVLLGCRRDGGDLRVEVWDTGPGMAAPEAARLFDPFFRLENEVRPRERGLGLGLTYARRLAELLGEELTLRSRPGRGSCFALTLHRTTAAPGPRDAEEEESFEVGLLAGLPSDAMGNPLAGAAVLLVEGAETTGLKVNLQTWGAAVTLVPPGGLTAALAETPDLIIVERQAFEAEQVLQQAASRPPVVLITGAGSAQSAAKTEAGVHVLQAPVKAARLRALCHYALSPAGQP